MTDDLFGNPISEPKRKEPPTLEQRVRSICNMGRLHYPHAEFTPELVEAWIKKVALSSRSKRCDEAGCGAMVYFICNHRTGAYVPYTADATCHYSNCTNPDRFRRRN